MPEIAQHPGKREPFSLYRSIETKLGIGPLQSDRDLVRLVGEGLPLSSVDSLSVEPVTLKSPYKRKTGKPWMRNSWVVFIDILGFSSRVKAATEAGTANELLQELSAALNEAKVDLIRSRRVSRLA